MLKTSWYGFLGSPGLQEARNAVLTPSNSDWITAAYLTNCQMAGSTNKFRFIQSVSSHFHLTHGLHLLVYREQFFFGSFHLKFWRFAEIRMEVVMKLDSEWLSRVRICWRLNTANLLNTASKWLELSCLPLLTLPILSQSHSWLKSWLSNRFCQLCCPVLTSEKHRKCRHRIPESRWLVGTWILTWWWKLKYISCKFCKRVIPRLKTNFRRKRKFYVTVTDVTTAKPPLSVVWKRLWNGMRNSAHCEKTCSSTCFAAKSSCSSPCPPSSLMLFVYAKRRYSADISSLERMGYLLSPQRPHNTVVSPHVGGASNSNWSRLPTHR